MNAVTTRQESTMMNITFRAPVARLNHVSNDGRVLCHEGYARSVRSRDIPLPLVAQVPDLDDQDGSGNRTRTYNVGNVDTLWVDGSTTNGVLLYAGGRLTTGPLAWHVAGAWELGLMNLQLDLDSLLDSDVFTVTTEESDHAAGPFLTVMTGWCVSALTLSSHAGCWDLPRPTLNFPHAYGQE